MSSIHGNIFEDLFVLELANNHWGKLDRGIKIVHDFGRVVRHNNVKASIKLQFRDVDNFVHKDFRSRTDIRYIKKTIDTKMSWESLGILCEEIRKNNCLIMATPFDEV
jgi:N-acetylneuraminate synthase